MIFALYTICLTERRLQVAEDAAQAFTREKTKVLRWSKDGSVKGSEPFLASLRINERGPNF